MFLTLIGQIDPSCCVDSEARVCSRSTLNRVWIPSSWPGFCLIKWHLAASIIPLIWLDTSITELTTGDLGDTGDIGAHGSMLWDVSFLECLFFPVFMFFLVGCNISGEAGALMETFFLISSIGRGLWRRIDFVDERLELEEDSVIDEEESVNPLSMLSLESDFSTLQITGSEVSWCLEQYILL